MVNYKPVYVSLHDDGLLFVADYHNSRVYLMNSQLTDAQIILYKYKHELGGLQRIYFIPENKQLIVGQTGGHTGALVSVFKCSFK